MRSKSAGSTWAGLAPASGPALVATDPLDRPRRWFAVLPGPGPDWADAVGHDPGITIVDGMALLLTDLRSLAEVRARVAGRLPEGVDTTLYPVDD